MVIVGFLYSKYIISIYGNLTNNEGLGFIKGWITVAVFAKM